MQKLFETVPGRDPTKLQDDPDPTAPRLYFYGVNELNHDLLRDLEPIDPSARKSLRTFSDFPVLHTGDVVLSMINPKAAIVSEECDGYLQTRNFMKIVCSESLDPKFLVFLINEDKEVMRMLVGDSDSTKIARVTMAGLHKLQNLKVPPIEEQRLIGEIYYNQLRISSLLEKKKKLEEFRTLAMIRRKLNGCSKKTGR